MSLARRSPPSPIHPPNHSKDSLRHCSSARIMPTAGFHMTMKPMRCHINVIPAVLCVSRTFHPRQQGRSLQPARRLSYTQRDCWRDAVFLILRCKPSETIAIATKLKHDRHILRLHEQDIQCPTRHYVRRVGRERHRDRRQEILLPSYIFIRWEDRLDLAYGLANSYAGVQIMKDADGSFATCKEGELQQVAASGFTKG